MAAGEVARAAAPVAARLGRRHRGRPRRVCPPVSGMDGRARPLNTDRRQRGRRPAGRHRRRPVSHRSGRREIDPDTSVRVGPGRRAPLARDV